MPKQPLPQLLFAGPWLTAQQTQQTQMCTFTTQAKLVAAGGQAAHQPATKLCEAH